jgi:hypothetical protein
MGLSHIAVSLPDGTLTPDWRSAFFDFYGGIFGWTEIENGARSDRFTVAIGGSCYLNIRERQEPMACTEYEHFGLVVESTDDVERLWAQVNAVCTDVDDIRHRPGGTQAFKFLHMLPLTMEIQYFPGDAATASPRPWQRSGS